MDQQLITDLIAFIENANDREADRHYDTYIFKPRHPGDTPGEKYLDEYNSEAKDLLAQLRALEASEDEDEDDEPPAGAIAPANDANSPPWIVDDAA